MALLAGFEYDIFISYRHNDNLDGWVTDFVQDLEKELRSTLKDSVTIYFDKNLHDGLLETHSVDKSLEGKLKCLIFIPIISQTYCDPKSFAWQHEFCAFNKLAKEDALGRDIRLATRNVASRILPIKIHELDGEDQSLLERELGGVLRAVDFIYKESGVNRPLRSQEENPTRNQNLTVYRNQVNKVANAIKEIIVSLKNPVQPGPTSPSDQEGASDNRPWPLKTITVVTLMILAIAALIYATSQFMATTKEQPIDADKSIAVLPFVDLSESHDQGWFGDGLTEEILNSLTRVKGLRVSSRTSSFAFKDKNLRIEIIADSLGVNYVVEGSVRKSGDDLRITAQLIRARDGFHLWSNTYDRKPKDIFEVQTEIATKIAESLDISLDTKVLEQMRWAGTHSAEAYLAFLRAGALFNEGHRLYRFIDLAKLKEANSYYEESMRIDPEFVNPYLYHADFFLHYLLEDDPTYKDTLTDRQAYRLFMNDLANMISRSRELNKVDYYRIPQVMYSNDWTDFRRVIEKSLYSKDAVINFMFTNFDLTSLLISLGYGPRISEISGAILQQDPSDYTALQNIVLCLIHAGKFQKAIERLPSFKPTGSVNIYILYSMVQVGQLNEAWELVMQDPNQDYYAYYDLKALILARQGKLEEAKAWLTEDHRYSPLYLFAVDATFGRKVANEEAAKMDKKLLLDFPLFRSYLLSPNDLPYDLAVAPNFAKKLRQAGPMKGQP